AVAPPAPARTGVSPRGPARGLATPERLRPVRRGRRGREPARRATADRGARERTGRAPFCSGRARARARCRWRDDNSAGVDGRGDGREISCDGRRILRLAKCNRRVSLSAMKIVHVASEAFPYIKTGGLADAVGALAGAL